MQQEEVADKSGKMTLVKKLLLHNFSQPLLAESLTLLQLVQLQRRGKEIALHDVNMILLFVAIVTVG